ncbi:TIR domain-containing protein [Nocardia sp. NPDC052254]|uniref:TIR domain-containing protein n=1 Tax=Nocardia sp. NPDC052254 TaxID=3155681 RepID=UPI00341BD253
MLNVFISYSRRDFYAAEALSSILATSDEVSTWLDAEQLRPGTEWEVAIDAAVDHADVVVVVASPAAMASRWVTQEWRRAISNGTPVHVALIRGTELPAELATVHDLRGRFFTESRTMVDVLLGHATPGPRRRFPLSPPMALLWAALSSCVAIMAMGAGLGWNISEIYRPVHTGFSRMGLGIMLVNVLAGTSLVVVMARLLRRTATPMSVREGLIPTCLGVVVSLIGTVIVGSTSYREAAGPEARTDSAWLYLVAGGAVLVAFILMSRSRTIHMEMPTGWGDDFMRGRSTGRDRPISRLRGRRFAHAWAAHRPKIDALKQVSAVGSAATYWIWCHPEDKPFANMIAGTCESAGFTEDEDDPRWAFIVVSTRTPVELLRTAHEVFGYRVVFVLATSLQLLDDYPELRRHQWLDFREQQPQGLYEFLHTVITGLPGERGVVTVPMGVRIFRAPRYVTAYLTFGRILVGVAVVPALGLLLAGNIVKDIPVMLVTVPLVAAVLNLMRRTADRTIAVSGWSIRTVLVLLLFVGWLVVTPNYPHIPAVNRIFLLVFVPLHLFGSAPAMMRLWLPPGQEMRLASPPVPPVRYTFWMPLLSLVLAIGYSTI